MAGSRGGAEAAPLRPAEAHCEAMAGQLPASARAAPTRPSSCTRSWRTWPASGSRPGSRARSSASARSRPCWTPTTPPAPRPRATSTPRKTLTLGDRARSAATSIGSMLDSEWEGEFCRVAEGASAGACLREEPQPRVGSALPLRLRDAEVYPGLHRAGG